MTQTPEQKEALASAEASRPSDEELRRLSASVPPLKRDEEHSFIPAEDLDRETDPELVQPVGEAATNPQPAEEPGTLTMTRPDRAESTYERSAAVSEVDLERMSDEQIRESGVLDHGVSRVHPSRLQPHQRPRQPGQYAPAAGAGSWPE